MFKNEVTSRIDETKFIEDQSHGPNKNCDLLCNLLSYAYINSLGPNKQLSKRNQPHTPWITQGLLRYIKTRDKLCAKLLKCKDINRRINLGTQLKNHRKISSGMQFCQQNLQ